MIRVPSYVSASPISGLGVFADRAVAKDTLVWSFEPDFDKRFTVEEYEALRPDLKAYIETYSYLSVVDGLIYFPFDHDRYMNHSEAPNIRFDVTDGRFYAARDIAKDEEMTCDYRQFNANWDKYEHIYEGLRRKALKLFSA